MFPKCVAFNGSLLLFLFYGRFHMNITILLLLKLGETTKKKRKNERSRTPDIPA